MSSYKNRTTEQARTTLELLYLPSFQHPVQREILPLT